MRGAPGNSAQRTHLSQGVAPPIFTAAPPQYFPGCFPLAFLEGRCSSSPPAATSVCLDPVTWDPSAPSNRVASSSSTSSRSCWRYSLVLLFLSSSSATLCLSASSLALASTSLLAFWATRSARRASAASCSRRRDCCSSSCHRCIWRRCSSSILALFCETSEWVGEDIIMQKQEQKTLFSVYVLLTQVPSRDSQINLIGLWINSIGLQRLSPKGGILSYTSPPVQKTTSLRWCHLWTLQAHLPQRPPFSQHISWRCCNPPGILSSTAEILLFNSVFHDGVDPVSVSTLKLLLGVIGLLH